MNRNLLERRAAARRHLTVVSPGGVVLKFPTISLFKGTGGVQVNEGTLCGGTFGPYINLGRKDTAIAVRALLTVVTRNNIFVSVSLAHV